MASFSSEENPPASYIQNPSPQTPLGAVAELNQLSSSRPALTGSSQAMAHLFLLHGLIPTGGKHAVSFPTIKPTVSPDLPFLSRSGRFSASFQPEHPRRVVARGLPFRSPSAPSVRLTPLSCTCWGGQHPLLSSVPATWDLLPALSKADLSFSPSTIIAWPTALPWLPSYLAPSSSVPAPPPSLPSPLG